MLAWSIWNSWNKLIFENASPDAFNPVRFTFCSYLDFILASKRPNRVSGFPNGRSRQQSPLLGRVKLNTNVTCFEDGNRGVDFIIPDSQGQVLMFAYKRIKVLNSPSEGEALALIFGLQLAGEVSSRILDGESDNLQLICCLQGRSLPNNALGLLMKIVLSSSRFFISVSFSHCFRQTNELAHHLARFTSFSSVLVFRWKICLTLSFLFVDANVLNIISSF